MEEGSDDGLKVHKRPANGTDNSESAPKKAKQAAPEESEDDERNKRTLFVRNLPFTVTKEQVSTYRYIITFFSMIIYHKF